MNYPVEYTVIAENEKIHIEGGADYWGLFNYLIGDYLRDAVLSETRSAVWSSAKKGSTEPLQNWFKNFKSMGIMGMIGYIYGIYHLGEKITPAAVRLMQKYHVMQAGVLRKTI